MSTNPSKYSDYKFSERYQVLHIYEFYFVLYFFNEKHSLQIQPSFLAPRSRGCLKGKILHFGTKCPY